MAYQLYLYKEFITKSGNDIRLEIFERDYSGSAIEIDSLTASPVQFITDNASNDLTVNIIKSSVVIRLVDTEQIDYTRLFTSDATKFKVIVKINNVTEWTGYLTPDSFFQPLTYRNVIQLTARDNLGMLSEFIYQEEGLSSISTIIGGILDKINFGCTLEYRVKKVDENSTNIINGLLNQSLFLGRSYEEVLSIILGGMGCQMRFVGENKYVIFDLADLHGYGESEDAQDFFFVERTGNIELVPAWKDLQVKQSYGTSMEVLTQRPRQSDLVFVANKTILTDYDYNTPPVAPSVSIPTYTPFGNNWVGTLPILSPYEWGYDKNTILLTKMSEADFENTLSYPSHIEYFKDVPAYNNGIKITFNVHNMLMMPDYDLFTAGKQVLTDRSPILGSKTTGYGIIICYNIFLVSGGVTYRLGETWEVAGSSPKINVFYIDEAYKDQDKLQNGIDIPCEINILSLQAGGQLQFHLYGFYIYSTLTDAAYFDFIAKISEFKFQLLSEEPGGRETVAVNNDNFNIKGGIDLYVGQVPTGKLNSLSMLGGIYQNSPPYYPPMAGFKRIGGAEMHLSEQIGREYLNLRKEQRVSLTGTIMRSGLPHIGRAFTYEGKNYALNYGSLDYESEQMQVELIEVEPYIYEDYTFVEAEVATGSGSLGSGSTEFIQWSSAGNAQRIYELDTASEEDQGGAFVFIDKSGLTAAKKVPISSLLVDAYTKTESDSRFASIDGDLTQDFSAKKLTTATLLLPQAAPILASGEVAIYSTDSGFSGELPSGAGSVTSIALTMPTGFSVSGSPITESGTFGVTFASDYFLPTTTQFATKADVSLIGAANGIVPLDSGGKVALQYLPSTLLKYMGVWDASTNTPTLLATDTNRKGQVWNVSVAGTQFGIAFKLGDWLIYNDSGVAEKSDNSDDVVSVNGYTGAVTLKTSDIAEQTNLYYTDARVKAYSDLNYLGISAKAADSDKLDGLDSADLIRTRQGYIANMNNAGNYLDNSTFYWTPGTIGKPDGGYGVCLAIKDNTDWHNQFGFGTNGELYFRQAINTSDFTGISWAKLYHSGNSNLTSVNWSAAKLTSITLLLPQTAPTLASGEMAIYGLESGFSGEMPSGAGSVESVALVSNLTGISVTGSPITTSGTFTLNFVSGYSIPTNIKQGEWDNAYTLRHNAVTLGTANGLSLSTQILSLALATTTTSGAMSSSDKTKLDGIAANANNYTLPTATASVLGGVKIGTNVTITDGVISVHNPVTLGTANGLSLSTQVLSLELASNSRNGALSSDDWNTFNGKQAKLIGTGASSLVRVNTSGTIAYDNNTYLTGNQTITLSGIITGSGTTAITTAIADGALSIAKTNGLQTALDGKLSTTGKAADSDKFDGIDSSRFVYGDNERKSINIEGITILDNVRFSAIGIRPSATDTSLPEGLHSQVLHSQHPSADAFAFQLMSPYLGSEFFFRKLSNGVWGNLYKFYHSGNSNLTTIDWSAKNLTLNGSISGVTTITASSTIQATTAKLTNLTDGYIPYHISDASGLGNSPISTDGTNVNLGSGKATMTENINTNLRIPKVAPTSPTSGQYYFYIVE